MTTRFFSREPKLRCSTLGTVSLKAVRRALGGLLRPRTSSFLACTRVKPGKPFKALMLLTVGVWWLQAAIDATVDHLPVVNPPDASDASEAAEELRSLMATY